MTNLRPYQVGAITKAREELASGLKRIIVYSPTGSGKTEIGMALIRSAVAKGKRVAFIANRVGLVDQSSKRFFKAGIAHGIIQADNTRNYHSQVVVCSIQTVARRGIPDVDLIVIDEAHGVAGSKDYRALIMNRDNVPVIGLTATPFSRGLGKHFDELGGCLFQCVVEAATISELIELGFLVDCDIYAPSEPDLSGVKTQRNQYGEIDYVESQLGEAVDKPQLVGSIVEHWLQLANNKPTVCFATNIAHSKHIVEEFNTAGITAEHIDCYVEEEERQEILGRVLSGETKVISNVSILAEGWDFPACEVMILARPTKSLIRYIQMAGRVLRIFDGKERALILDHSGSTSKLGYPTDDLPLELDDGRPNKTESKQKKEDELPKKCPSCHFMRPAKVHVCPACGFIPEKQSSVRSEEGKLVKLERTKATAADKQDIYSQLFKVAKDKGYQNGWVDHKYRAYFGVWPRGLQDIAKAPSEATLKWITSQNIRMAKGRKAA